MSYAHINPLIFIEGRSGTGKSTAIENLIDNETVILNTGQKPLPFKKKFSNNIYVTTPGQLITDIDTFSKDNSKKVLVIDTLTEWLDMLLHKSRREKKGFEIYNAYNESVSVLFNKLQESKKIIFLIAHTEIVTTPEGDTFVAAKVKGKEWEGYLESKALITLTSRMVRDTESQTNNYFFETQSDGRTSSKSPRGMFERFLIPNDYKLIVDVITNYYADEEQIAEPSEDLKAKAEKFYSNESVASAITVAGDELNKMADEVVNEAPTASAELVKPEEKEESIINSKSRKFEDMSEAQKRVVTTSAINAVKSCKSMDDLSELWYTKYVDLHEVGAFKEAVRNKRLEIEAAVEELSKKKVVNATDEELEAATGGKIEKPVAEPSLTVRTIIETKMDEIDAMDISNTAALELFGELMFQDIDKLNANSEIPTEEIEKLIKYFREKWEIFANGQKWPFVSKYNAVATATNSRIRKVR